MKRFLLFLSIQLMWSQEIDGVLSHQTPLSELRNLNVEIEDENWTLEHEHDETFSEQDKLIQQVEQLLSEENPIIEQMLEMAQGLGDNGEESKMILMMDDAKQNDEVPQETQQIQMVELPHMHQKPKDVLNTNINEQLDKQYIQEELAAFENSLPASEAQKVQWTAQIEFFIGALMVFVSFPILWSYEARKIKFELIMEDIIKMEARGQIHYAQGKPNIRNQILDDPLTNLRIVDSLRFYRKVEEIQQIDNDVQSWKERNIDWFSQQCSVDSIWCSWMCNAQHVTIDGFEINEQLILKLNDWEPIQFDREVVRQVLADLQVIDYAIQDNNIYIKVDGQQLKITVYTNREFLLCLFKISIGIFQWI